LLWIVAVNNAIWAIDRCGTKLPGPVITFQEGDGRVACRIASRGQMYMQHASHIGVPLFTKNNLKIS
jgi:hypothetical protein